MSGTGAERIQKYTNALTAVFTGVRDKREANRQSRSLLEDMSGDSAFFSAVLAKHLQTPKALNTRHYPVVGLDIVLNPHFGLVANCWIPLPDRSRDISTKAIHHHGDMLLSTVTAFGPGYEHWTFTTPTAVDDRTERYTMRLIERAPHPLHHVAFVDSYIAHLPLYPEAMSITFALWSSRFPTGWKDRVKRLPLLQKNSDRLRKMAARFGVQQQLELKVVEYFDFFPTCDGFQGIKERKEFERGPNSDYLASLFHVIQQTGNEGLAPLVEEQLNNGSTLENPELVRQLLSDLKAGRPIEGRLSPTHYAVDHANFSSRDIEQALAAQEAAR
jgi:hypothetical protein